MKKFAFLGLLILATNAVANDLPTGNYIGNNNGSECSLDLSNRQSDVRADVHCELDKVKVTEKKLYLKGFNEVEYCKVEVLLDSKGIPTEYKLTVRNLLSPFYKDAGHCKNLQKTN